MAVTEYILLVSISLRMAAVILDGGTPPMKSLTNCTIQSLGTPTSCVTASILWNDLDNGDSV